MDSQLDGQAAREGDGENRKDHEAPGFISHVEAEGRHQRTKPGEEPPFPRPASRMASAWVTLRNQEDGEDDGDEVLLFVRLDDDEPQQKQEGRDG